MAPPQLGWPQGFLGLCWQTPGGHVALPCHAHPLSITQPWGVLDSLSALHSLRIFC